MRESSKFTQYIVGLTVIIAMALIVITIIMVGDVLINQDRKEILMEFDNVSGLEEGDPVWVLGIPMGIVDSLNINGDKVIVRAFIDNKANLYKDARAEVFDLGVIGQRCIGIYPGTSDTLLAKNALIPGDQKMGIGEMLGYLADAINDIRAIVARVDTTALNQATLDTIRVAFNNLSQTSGKLLSAVSNANATMSEFRAASKNVNDATQDLRGLITGMDQDLKQGMAGFSETTQNLAAWSTSLQQATTNLNSIVSKIDSGQGDLGKLISDDALTTELQKTIKNLDSLVKDIKVNPKKYLKVSLF